MSKLSVINTNEWIILCVLLIGFTKGQDYVISNGKATSANFSQLCTLATPPINFTNDGEFIDLNITTATENTWVGYVKTEALFIYIGCTRLNDTYRMKETTADPGICLTYCNYTKYVGIATNGNTKGCFCFDYPPDVLDQKLCSRTCEFPSDTLCGDINGSMYYISVYEADLYVGESQLNQGKRCLAFEHEWRNCSNLHMSLCEKGNGEIVILTTNGNKTWSQSMSSCLQNNLLPARPRGSMNVSHNGNNFFWLGTIRSLAIVKITDVKGIQSNYHYGYINATNVLYFDQNSSSLFPALCVNVNTPPSQSQETTTERTTLTTTFPESTNLTTAETAFSGSLTSSTVVNIAAHSEHENHGFVALYVIVPLVIAVAAIVIGIMIWRTTRRAITKEFKQTGSGKVLDRKLNKPVENDSALEHSPGTVRHDAVILESADSYAEIKNNDIGGTGNGKYDTTKCASMDRNDTGNTYNKLGTPDDTYDHLHNNKNRDDDTYSHANAKYNRDNDTYSHAIVDATYDTTYTLYKSKKEQAAVVLQSDTSQPNNDDDTYNHLI